MDIRIICNREYTKDDVALAMKDPRNPRFDEMDNEDHIELLLVAAACLWQNLNPYDTKDFDNAIGLVQSNMCYVMEEVLNLTVFDNFIRYTIDNIEKQSGFWPAD